MLLIPSHGLPVLSPLDGIYYGDNRFDTVSESGTATLKARPRVRPLLTFLPLVSTFCPDVRGSALVQVVISLTLCPSSSFLMPTEGGNWEEAWLTTGRLRLGVSAPLSRNLRRGYGEHGCRSNAAVGTSRSMGFLFHTHQGLPASCQALHRMLGFRND